MQAIEFETYIKEHAIHLPLQFQHLENMKAKVIVLYAEPQKTGNYNKQSLLIAFAKAQKKGVFKHITDAVSWQNQLRDEWE